MLQIYLALQMLVLLPALILITQPLATATSSALASFPNLPRNRKLSSHYHVRPNMLPQQNH